MRPGTISPLVPICSSVNTHMEFACACPPTLAKASEVSWEEGEVLDSSCELRNPPVHGTGIAWGV